PALIELGDLKVSIPGSSAAHPKPDPKRQPVDESKAGAKTDTASALAVAEQKPRIGLGRFAGTVRLEGTAPEPDLQTKRNGSLRIIRTADNGIAGVFIYLPQAP